VDIISFDISAEGLNLITIDAAHVFLIEINLNARTAFSKFECQDRNVGVSVKVEWLHRIFKNVKQDDTVILQVHNGDELEIV